jgi:hypothetical protein
MAGGVTTVDYEAWLARMARMCHVAEVEVSWMQPSHPWKVTYGLRWFERVPSDRQRAVLVDRGETPPPTRGEAAERIGEIARAESWDT